MDDSALAGPTHSRHQVLNISVGESGDRLTKAAKARNSSRRALDSAHRRLALQLLLCCCFVAPLRCSSGPLWKSRDVWRAARNISRLRLAVPHADARRVSRLAASPAAAARGGWGNPTLTPAACAGAGAADGPDARLHQGAVHRAHVRHPPQREDCVLRHRARREGDEPDRAPPWRPPAHAAASHTTSRSPG